MNRPRILCIGEAMLELRRDDARWCLGAAGDTLNTAVYLARQGFDVGYLSALGCDPFSDSMIDNWRAEGIDTGSILRDPDRLPGLYAIETDPDGERSFYYWRERSAARRLFELAGIDAALAAAAGTDLLYLSGITLSLFDGAGQARLDALAQAVRAGGGQVVFDPNYRPRGWPDADAARSAFARIAPAVSLALPTHLDERALHGDADGGATARRWHDLGVAEVVVKLGADGCLISDASGMRPVAATAGVRVIDTTGAGDSFNAGYIGGRLSGLAAPAAAALGNALAAVVIGHPGAIVPPSATAPLLGRPMSPTDPA